MRYLRQCKRWALCPLCTSGVTGITNHQAELNRIYFELRSRSNDEMGIKRPDPVAGDARAVGLGKSTDDWILYPTLMEYLTASSYEDGSARRPATLTVFCDQGQVKASVNDRDLDRVAFCTAETIEGLLVLLEDKLKTSSIEWRPSQGKPQRRK